MKTALEIIRGELIGDSFHRFSLGDTLDLKFSKCFLTAQEFSFDSNNAIAESIKKVFPAAALALNPSDISGSAALATAMRCEVVDLLIRDNGALCIFFDNGSVMTLPTDTDIVDWHWALTRTETDPYLDFIIGAFDDGTIQINQECEQAVDGNPH